ncbi:MAG: acylphosphatase [bacterium]|nr:acylphosphatase [bacterium]
MNKCLRITITADFPEGFLYNFVQKSARKCNLEGVAQVVEEDRQVRIIICGSREDVDQFLDLLHKGPSKFVPENIEIEPFLKDKDYRGVFRVIE